MNHPFRSRSLIVGSILALLLISVQSASAKGLFSKITIQMAASEQTVDVNDPAFLNFWMFSDFTNGTRQTPHLVGPAYEVTRWHLADDGKSFVAWDRLRYYHTSSENTDGRGWIFYEGLVNGGSEYDGQWFVATRNADALMETVIFAEPNSNTAAPPSSSTPDVALTSTGAVMLFAFAVMLWLIQSR